MRATESGIKPVVSTAAAAAAATAGGGGGGHCVQLIPLERFEVSPVRVDYYY